MKNLTLSLLITTFCITSATATSGQIKKLDVEFADTDWNGIAVPQGQQCLKFGGDKPATPRLKISDVPAGTTAIIMEYSDKAYKPMDNGGHGKLAYRVGPYTTHFIIPAIKGHTFELPATFYSVSAHQGPDWDKAGAYMPPCSGGNKHPYQVLVKAVKQQGPQVTIFVQQVLEMGLY
ncbi:MAG: hypothetical protein HRT54_20150 [Colwellia sp.]|nr:hypothetical protein [Colwellia sp.]